MYDVLAFDSSSKGRRVVIFTPPGEMGTSLGDSVWGF